MSDRYADYDPFARVYNQHWGEMFLPRALAVTEEVLLPRIAAGARILDLCCGTGRLAHVLRQRGYHLTGLDGSAAMLSYARENAPDVELILDDARSFSLPSRFDAVTCMFDSLNHIMSLEDLTSAFRAVYAALEDGGMFLFDLNMEAGYVERWNGVYGIVEDDHVCVFRNRYEPPSKMAFFEATLFRLEEGAWRRSEFILKQKCHTREEVESALHEAGFAVVNVFDYDGAAGQKALDPGTTKAFFLSRKATRTAIAPDSPSIRGLRS